MTRLKAAGLVKRYGKREVVSGVSIEIQQGEVVGLLGPNGAGKTTCFYMLVGLIAPDLGQVKIGPQDVTGKPMHARARLGLGYLAQEPSIFRKLSVSQNLDAVLELKDLDHEDIESKRTGLLQQLGLYHLADQKAISLSGGERRRLEIARALAMEPKFILLDEPFAGVDPKSVLEIQRIVTHLAETGIGILITDHNVRETLGCCNRAYIINQGRVLTEGNPDDILSHSEVRSVYLGEDFTL